jgi:hypothetical protein
VCLEHIQNVAYHLEGAAESSRRATELAGGVDVVHAKKSTLFVGRADAMALLRAGDQAIREAVCAVETGLMTVNQVLRLGVAAEERF